MKRLHLHTTCAIEDLKKKSQSDLLKMFPSSISSVPLCLDHDCQKLDFYCTQCAVPVCVRCSTARHKDRPVKEISQQISQNIEELLQAIQGMPQKKKQLEQVVESIDETMKKLGDCKNKVYSNIEEVFMKLRKLIDQHEEKLLGECRRMAISKETSLSIQKECLQHLAESMSECHSLASIATSQYTDVQLLSIAQTLRDRADSLQQQFTDTSLDLCETPDISVEVNTDALVKMITQFGGVADSSPSCSNTTVVVPCRKLGIGAEMKVKVTTRDSSGKEFNKRGSVVRGVLTYQGRVECPVSDNGDGTYIVSVIPQQLGQHQLSITENSQYIQGSPFKLSVVAPRDYTKLKDPVQTITGIQYPACIAFTDDGDMFVTSDSGNCIHVYDHSGKQKTTIGSRGSGQLQFESPYGIDISGEEVYVAEWRGQRIHKLTKRGEFLSTFGEKGSKIEHFNNPYDVKVGPDGKVYVTDTKNSRIQVFNPDFTISHVIDCNVPGDGRFSSPFGIAFDLSGNVHVGRRQSSSVTVFTPSG